MKIVIIGLSITSSWGNGHATTYRALLKEVSKLGHDVLFLEKDVPWYAPHRDLPNPDFCTTVLYKSNEELYEQYHDVVANADAVIVGSYVQQGVEVGEWVVKTARGIRAFYDIDTPVTLAKLKRGDYEYLSPDLIAGYDLYLSFTGGPVLQFLEEVYGSPAARALYCSVDPEHYYPVDKEKVWDMGYLGTYSTDRQPTVNELLCKTAMENHQGKFVVAGPQYPQDIVWRANVERIEHLPPALHRDFYNQQKYTLNVTRQDMIAAGWSPSVRLFEAAACGVPIISDYWEGLTELFEEGTEILIAHTHNDVTEYLQYDNAKREAIGLRARQKILRHHTASVRAAELLQHLQEVQAQVASTLTSKI